MKETFGIVIGMEINLQENNHEKQKKRNNKKNIINFMMNSKFIASILYADTIFHAEFTIFLRGFVCIEHA